MISNYVKNFASKLYSDVTKTQDYRTTKKSQLEISIEKLQKYGS